MSLQVWLPLTRDLRQQGLSDVTVTNNGATYSASGGKLGGCYNFDGTDDNLSFTPNVDGLENLSIAFWACPAASIPSGSFFSLERLTYWQITFYNDYVAIRDNSIGYSGNRKNFSTGTYVANTWTHIAITYNKGILKIYRDGSLLSTNSVGGTKLNTEIDNARIGSAVQSGYYHAGKICDVRIYDHCLSPMEVKELAKGLVLHYPLNRGGFGQENLMLNSNKGWHSNEYNVMQGYLSEPWVIGDAYTVQVKGTPTPGKQFGIWADKGATIFGWFNNINGIWVATFTVRQYDYQYPTNFAIYDYDSSGSHNATIEWVKVEKGSIPTPWSPAPSDDLATQMGLNSNIEYDTSGYCNNGIRTGTFSWTSDTPKYSVSTQFNGTEYILKDSFTSEILTLSAWIKTSKNKSTSQFVVADLSSQICISIYSGCIIGYYGASGSQGVGSKCTLGSSYKENDWNHIVVVKTGIGTRTIYCNGVELTPTSNDYWTANGPGFMIGARTTSLTLPFYGEICDVRAYATALSADDVLSLYQNCATIGADGTIYGQIRA